MPLDYRFAPYAVTLQRVALGLMFLADSLWLKLFVFTLPGTAQFFGSIGLPGSLAYAVFAAEAAGGVLLILGVQTRWVGLALLPVLAGATWAHAGNGWMFANPNGGWEYAAFLTLLAFTQFLLGDGRFACRPRATSPRLHSASKSA